MILGRHIECLILNFGFSKVFKIKSHAKTQIRQVKKIKLGLFKIIFAALRENQSSLIGKIESRPKRNDILKIAIERMGTIYIASFSGRI